MEIGWYHEFHRQTVGQSDADAFATGLDQVAQAEAWGLDAVWLAEIHQQAARSVLSAPVTVLATLAGMTSRLKLGTGVQVLPLAHPLRLAEETATVDQISRGRLLLGAGRSGNPNSYAAYGVPYAESRERFFETLDILKLAWTESPFTYQGKFHSLNAARAAPGPFRRCILRSGSPVRRRTLSRCWARLVIHYSSLCGAARWPASRPTWTRIGRPTGRSGIRAGARGASPPRTARGRD